MRLARRANSNKICPRLRPAVAKSEGLGRVKDPLAWALPPCCYFFLRQNCPVASGAQRRGAMLVKLALPPITRDQLPCRSLSVGAVLLALQMGANLLCRSLDASATEPGLWALPSVGASKWHQSASSRQVLWSQARGRCLPEAQWG